MRSEFPYVPSRGADACDWADFAELACLATPGRRASRGDVIADLRRQPDDDPDRGADEDARFEAIVDAALEEVGARALHAGGGDQHRYPFELDPRREAVTVDESALADDNRILYLYLLSATVLNMRDDRRHAGIDGALLFERVCAEAARSYLGSDRVESVVFGTARRAAEDGEASFASAVSALCTQMKEGLGYRDREDYAPRQQDGKLDVVAWRPFSDDLPGKLVVFGQCKTGTHWQSELQSLQPRDFMKKWMRENLAVDPVRMFFIAARLPARQRPQTAYNHMVDGGVLLDRCRILDVAPTLDEDLLAQVRQWTVAALKSKGIVLA